MTFYSANVRHAIYIERYKARTAREIMAAVEGLSQELYQLIASLDLQAMTRRDLDRLLAQVNALVQSRYQPATKSLEAALIAFVSYEGEWTGESLRRFGLVADVAVPSDADLWAGVYSRPFQGRLLRDWLKDLPANTSARVRQVIRQGYVDGISPIEIARQIRGTRGRNGIMDISKRGAEAMARTAIAHTSSRARELTYKASGVSQEQWVSVLDGRTSPICRANDGNIYEVGKGPRPPAHVNCRSTMIPVTSGNRAALETRPTYNDWLRQQPANVQDDVLGPTRGKLFRGGGLTVDKFTDRAGQEYTLDQLRQRDKEAFEEAGLAE